MPALRRTSARRRAPGRSADRGHRTPPVALPPPASEDLGASADCAVAACGDDQVGADLKRAPRLCRASVGRRGREHQRVPPTAGRRGLLAGVRSRRTSCRRATFTISTGTRVTVRKSADPCVDACRKAAGGGLHKVLFRRARRFPAPYQAGRNWARALSGSRVPGRSG
jgi:hypothetical protein